MQTRDSSLYLSDDDLYLLARGEWYRSYDKMGAHQAVDENGTEGFHFAVWAPQVKSVHVIGKFNNWDEGPIRSPRPRPAMYGRALSPASRWARSTSS